MNGVLTFNFCYPRLDKNPPQKYSYSSRSSLPFVYADGWCIGARSHVRHGSHRPILARSRSQVSRMAAIRASEAAGRSNSYCTISSPSRGIRRLGTEQFLSDFDSVLLLNVLLFSTINLIIFTRNNFTSLIFTSTILHFEVSHNPYFYLDHLRPTILS